MKKIVISIILCMFIAPVFSQEGAADIWIPGDESVITPQTIETGERSPMVIPTNPVLWDNGPLVTHPGGGFGGADASAVQTGLNMNTYGFGHQVINNYWMADEFTVPSGGWNIGGFGFFAYQTNSDLNSTFTAVHIMIYDGPPDNPSSNVIFGDGVTNMLTSSDFSNIYRVLDTDLNNNIRPIFQNSCMFEYFLPAGTYWVAWQADGTLGSGPWCPPITVLGQTSTGNALQYVGSWAAALDTGLGTPQDMPFIVYGSLSAVPVSNWAIIIGIVLILTFAVFRFRRIS